MFPDQTSVLLMAVCVGSVPVGPERLSQGEAGRASEGAKEGRRKYTEGRGEGGISIKGNLRAQKFMLGGGGIETKEGD